MIIYGKPIADRIQRRLKSDLEELDFVPELALIQVEKHPAIDSFVAIKKRVAGELGIKMSISELEEGSNTDQVITEIEMIARSLLPDGKKKYQGLVVQLPLPSHIDTDKVLKAIPRELDIDVLSPEAEINMYQDGVLPPVVGAVREVLREIRFDLSLSGVAVIGNGRLVGRPVIEWLRAQGVDPKVVTLNSGNLEEVLKSSELVISGAGFPSLIKSDMITNKHVLIDAGTSESKGMLVGDIDPACAFVARAITPVPGGIGPITVAILFENFVTRLQSKYDRA